MEYKIKGPALDVVIREGYYLNGLQLSFSYAYFLAWAAEIWQSAVISEVNPTTQSESERHVRD